MNIWSPQSLDVRVTWSQGEWWLPPRVGNGLFFPLPFTWLRCPQLHSFQLPEWLLGILDQYIIHFQKQVIIIRKGMVGKRLRQCATLAPTVVGGRVSEAISSWDKR
jgi:hypothetical protein